MARGIIVFCKACLELGQFWYVHLMPSRSSRVYISDWDESLLLEALIICRLDEGMIDLFWEGLEEIDIV